MPRIKEEGGSPPGLKVVVHLHLPQQLPERPFQGPATPPLGITHSHANPPLRPCKASHEKRQMVNRHRLACEQMCKMLWQVKHA